MICTYYQLFYANLKFIYFFVLQNQQNYCYIFNLGGKNDEKASFVCQNNYVCLVELE